MTAISPATHYDPTPVQAAAVRCLHARLLAHPATVEGRWQAWVEAGWWASSAAEIEAVSSAVLAEPMPAEAPPAADGWLDAIRSAATHLLGLPGSLVGIELDDALLEALDDDGPATDALRGEAGRILTAVDMAVAPDDLCWFLAQAMQDCRAPLTPVEREALDLADDQRTLAAALLRHPRTPEGRAAAWAEVGWVADDEDDCAIISDEILADHELALLDLYLQGGVPALAVAAPGVTDLIGLAADLLAGDGGRVYEAMLDM